MLPLGADHAYGHAPAHGGQGQPDPRGPAPQVPPGPAPPHQPAAASIGKWKDADSKNAGPAAAAAAAAASAAAPGAQPVKAACLSCRQKKAKCDGVKPVCGQCSRKDIECIYIKSKRGGARKKRVPNPPSALVEYLKKLDGLLGVPQFGLHHAEPQEGDDPTNVVRTFGSREEILRCYYNEVHPYLPVMPPRHYLVDVLPTLLPDSPFLLAAQTIMTLIPHPLDPTPSSPQSKRLRSAASAQLGKQTLACIDRTQATMQSLEVVQALTILAVWEWGSTNDAETAIARCSTALQIATDMGLRDMDRGGSGYALEGIDWKMDSRRRTWWLLYGYQLTASLVSGLPAPIGPDDPSVQVDFPVCSDKDRTWGTWVNCIRQCYRVIGLVNELVFAEMGADAEGKKGWGAPTGRVSGMQSEERQATMLRADQQIMELMKNTERLSTIEHVPGGEEDVAKNQQIATRLALAVAHIHIHRWTAFPEVSLFSKRICGFPKGGNLPWSTSDDESSNPSDLSSPLHISSTSQASLTSPPGAGAGPLVTSSPGDEGPRPAQLPSPPLTQAPPSSSPLRLPPAPLASAAHPKTGGFPPTSDVSYTQTLPSPPEPLPPPPQFHTNSAHYNDTLQTQQNQTAYRGQTPLVNSAHRQQEAYQVDQMIASLGQVAPPGQFFAPSGLPPQSQPQAQFDGSLAQYRGTADQYANGAAQLAPGQFTSESYSGRSGQFTPERYNGSGGLFSPPYDTSPTSQLNAVPQPQSQYGAPPVQYNQQLFPPDAVQARSTLPPRTSSLPAVHSMASMPGQLQAALPPINVGGPPPVYNPAIQQQWHYDLQQDITEDMWQPEQFPSYLPTPWFAQPGGAATLVSHGDSDISSYPIAMPPPPAPPSLTGSATSSMSKKHRAWGIDEKGDVAPNALVQAAERADTFPPGISLARCATAAHTIVRLEVLHRSATLAMDGPPRWIPFCSCGLVSGAYAFLLLILAVQAETSFGEYSQERMDERADEVESLLTNVKIILAGLEAYGIMWEGIDKMAKEVRAVVEVATKLPMDIRSQRSSSDPPALPPP